LAFTVLPQTHSWIGEKGRERRKRGEWKGVVESEGEVEGERKGEG